MVFCGHFFCNLQQYMVELCNNFPFLFQAAFPGSHSALQKWTGGETSLGMSLENHFIILFTLASEKMSRYKLVMRFAQGCLESQWQNPEENSSLMTPSPASFLFLDTVQRLVACEPNWGGRVIIQGKIEKAEFNHTNWLIHQGTVQGELSWPNQQSAKLNFLLLIWATSKVWKSVRNPGKRTEILCWRYF